MGGDVCFEYGMLAHISGNIDLENDSWEKMNDAIMTGNYYELEDYDSPPLPITASEYLLGSNYCCFSFSRFTHISTFLYFDLHFLWTMS